MKQDRRTSSAPLRAFSAVLALGLLSVPVVSGMTYGGDLSAYDEAKGAGWTLAYGQLWVTHDSEKWWSSIEGELRTAKSRGVTPVIEWYYWGDSISVSCVKSGCAGRTQAKWNALGARLADTVARTMGGSTAIIVVETEFNKNGVETWEDFDGLLASHMGMLKSKAPSAKLAVGFGLWGTDKWSRFDRAMGTADFAGLQLMRGLTKDSAASYAGAPDALLAGAQKARSTFGKPILVHDIALASHNGLDAQQKAVQGLKDRRGSLEAAGVKALVWRDVRDYAGACTCWYYGEAERTFGLKTAGGSAKPAWHVWISMAGSGGGAIAPPPSTTPPPTGGSFSATFQPKGNTWWIQTSVSSASRIAKVEASVNGGSWVPLTAYSWGWAKSIYAPQGSAVKFRATSTDGSTATSGAYAWPPGASSGSTATGTFSASFSPYGGNAWWIQTKVSASKPLQSVAASVNGGAWTSLAKTSWGAWAVSKYAPSGSSVQFRATATDGSVAYSAKYVWPK